METVWEDCYSVCPHSIFISWVFWRQNFLSNLQISCSNVLHDFILFTVEFGTVRFIPSHEVVVDGCEIFFQPSFVKDEQINLSASHLGLLCKLQNHCCKPVVCDSSATSSSQWCFSSKNLRNSRKKFWEEILVSFSLRILSSTSFPPAHLVINSESNLGKHRYHH